MRGARRDFDKDLAANVMIQTVSSQACGNINILACEAGLLIVAVTLDMSMM